MPGTPSSPVEGTRAPPLTLFDLAERSTPSELKSAWDEADRLKRLRVPEVARVYELTSDDRVLQMAAAAVDVSVEEFFGAWFAGVLANGRTPAFARAAVGHRGY